MFESEEEDFKGFSDSDDDENDEVNDDSDNDFDDFDEEEEVSDIDDDETSVEDTWAALKKLKEAKANKQTSTVSSIKPKKNQKVQKEEESEEEEFEDFGDSDDFEDFGDSDDFEDFEDDDDDNEEEKTQPDSVEDTWAALKKLKESKSKAKSNGENKSSLSTNQKTSKTTTTAAEETMELLRKAKEKKNLSKKDIQEKQKQEQKQKQKQDEKPKKTGGRSLADLLARTTTTKGNNGSTEEDDNNNKFSTSNKIKNKKRKLPKNLQEGQKALFEKDDDDIDYYSRMLGLKSKNGKLPKPGVDEEDDGLDGILDGLDLDFSDYEDDEEEEGDDDDNAPKLVANNNESDDDEEEEFQGFKDSDNEEEEQNDDDDDDDKLPFSSDDEINSDDFDSDIPSDLDEEEEEAPRKRENPYVAPVVAGSQKYIPPSVRRRMEEEGNDDTSNNNNNGTATNTTTLSKLGINTEEMARLKRQVKGQLNRLTDGNISGIVKTLNDMYLHHPRQYVNETVTTTVLEAIAMQSTLSEKFLAVHAALIAALYRTAGLEFGAYFVQTLVEEFDKRYNNNNNKNNELSLSSSSLGSSTNKEAANLISMLAELYSFNIVWCGIIYDFVREFLKPGATTSSSTSTSSEKEKLGNGENGGGGLDEIKTELLLRILRASGPQLRSDDPRALRDIVVQLNILKAKASESGQPLGSRTLFMIGFIEDLKNNKQRKGGAGNNDNNSNSNSGSTSISLDVSGAAKETRKRMRDFLNVHVKAGKKQEPLRVSLDDIRNISSRGKWWLVGSAWRSKNMVDGVVSSSLGNQEEEKEEDEDDNNDPNKYVDTKALRDILENTEPDWLELARKQRMNTDVRRAVFVALMGARDYVDASDRLRQLRLRSKQEREIVRVLLHCCAMENAYNPYYSLVAARLCGSGGGGNGNGNGGNGVLGNREFGSVYNTGNTSSSTQHGLARTFGYCLREFLSEAEGEDSEDEQEGIGRLMGDDDDDEFNNSDGEGEGSAGQAYRALKQKRRLKRRQEGGRLGGTGPESTQALRKTVHLAKLYGSLVALGALPLSIIRSANFIAPSAETSVFLDLFFVTLFLRVDANGGVGTPSSGNGNGNGNNKNKNKQSTSKMGSGIAAAMFERKLDPESERGLVHLIAQTVGKAKKKNKNKNNNNNNKDEEDGDDDEEDKEDKRTQKLNLEKQEEDGLSLLRKIKYYLPKILQSEIVEAELQASTTSTTTSLVSSIKSNKSKIDWAVNLIVDAIEELIDSAEKRGKRIR